MRSPRLFSYIVRYDDGAAPNPFGGICSLAICKPRIRSVAEEGDWIAGVGSVNAQSGNLSGRLVYVMRVEKVLTLAEYDRRAAAEWPEKIPDVSSLHLPDRLGDCIYDFSRPKVSQRSGVHGKENMSVDLGGKNVLLSKDFYYFGSRAIEIGKGGYGHLKEICPVTRGHRSRLNDRYVNDCVAWLRGLNLELGQIHGWPDMALPWSDLESCGACAARADDDEAEEETKGVC